MGKTDDTKTGSGLMMTPSSTCFVKKKVRIQILFSLHCADCQLMTNDLLEKHISCIYG